MPYYFISVCVQSDPKILMEWRKGVRFDNQHDIDIVWNKYKLAAEEQYGRSLQSFELVMIARQSREYQTYIVKKGVERKSDRPPLKDDAA